MEFLCLSILPHVCALGPGWTANLIDLLAHAVILKLRPVSLPRGWRSLPRVGILLWSFYYVQILTTISRDITPISHSEPPDVEASEIILQCFQNDKHQTVEATSLASLVLPGWHAAVAAAFTEMEKNFYFITPPPSWISRCEGLHLRRSSGTIPGGDSKRRGVPDLTIVVWFCAVE